jgi:hypothetical protein
VLSSTYVVAPSEIAGLRMIPSAPAPDAGALAGCLQQPLPLTGDWSLWRLYAVRGAGFPVALLEAFTDAPLTSAIDGVLAADARLARARRALQAYCTTLRPLATDDPRRRYRHALRDLQRSRPLASPPDEPAAQPLLADYSAALAVAAAADAHYRRQFAATDLRMSQVAREVASEDRFRAAMAWQNSRALSLLTRHYHEVPVPGVDSRERKYRRLVASYAQRYAAKNEQVGFFGPVGWATIAGTHARLRAGDDVVRAVHPYYEYWALDAIARQLARRAAPALAPRLSASARIGVEGLVLPDTELPLDAVQREFLGALDGTLSASVLAQRYAGRADTGLAEPAAVYALLAQLAANDVVDWQVPLPVTVRAERDLAAAMARLPGIEDLTLRWQALEGLRAGIAAAPPAELPALIEAFEAAFAALADTSAHRLGGSAYAGRTPLYPDALRDLDLTLGEPIFTTLAPALAPVLDGAQWFSQQLLEQYQAFAVATWRELRGGGAVPLAELWSVLQQETETALAIGDDVVDQLQEKWREVLDIDEAARAQCFDPADVGARARAAFALAAPCWSGARFQSPDLMLAAASLEDFATGDWFAVLGEVHPCTNLMMQTVTGKLCPCLDEALAATARVQTEPELVPATARDARGHRTAYSLELPHDVAIEHGGNRSWRDPAHVVHLADLQVIDYGHGPVVATRDGAREWSLAQFIGPQLRSIGINRYKPLRVGAHLPRLRIGRLVLQRESWQIAVTALDFVRLHDRAQRLLALRRWARGLGLPRYCFYRIPGELKPYFLDLESPLFCDLFADGVRQAAADGRVGISEMLPDPQQSWLTDGRGQRYTSELRMGAHTSA